MDLKSKIDQIKNKLKTEADILSGKESKSKVFESVRQLTDQENGEQEWSKAQQRLFDVDRWSDVGGISTASFLLHDSMGNRVTRKIPQVGDKISIDLPGPLPLNWVEVVQIKEEPEKAEFIVCPTSDPTKTVDSDQDFSGEDLVGEDQVTDHFFTSDALSIFRVERKGKQLTATQIGLHEKINNSTEEAGNKALLNTLVAESGWLLFQPHQWQTLTDYVAGISQK
ncbi:hypothetical protein QNI19_11150 [Cytophagaceae bacterium DM2B3-1]|uniref:Uncharacterized protein n=1 Tax=Xanthocytophaga flava TaxID=3048013 RepID=A0AAE3U8L6_9BACT|nr:hypothetical protein [Xanthocytophaga flavus]MDJ1480814.1 hypothetical protein [Xanthocytophaga flavus]MDJ1493490.1 hypothetical protein [Xanthocytophaga flavus]